ncbi:MAG: M20/M25/M40 family metallo-hydrolase, partial [Bacteroidota bacterium]
MSEPRAYDWLDYLSNRIGGRLSGSPEAAAAVEFTRQVMDTLGLDRVYLQEVMVPHWVRGEEEEGRILSPSFGNIDVPVCALGNAVATPEIGLSAPIVEVKSFEELEKLGEANIKGKIVFFNRPMNPNYIQTFRAYGEAASQRGSGPSEAAKYGAVGAVVRSLTTSLDDVPHTGSLRYKLNIPQIPAIAISTKGAEKLSTILKADPATRFFFKTSCQMLDDILSYNVIGEIKGTEKPDEIIVVGGHLDSWDTGDGAHDDGAGCVQSIEVLRIIKALGIRPKRTIRAVMFMNEENGLRGGRKYAARAEENKENHIAALESDAGGFTPRALGIGDAQGKYKVLKKWTSLFEPYGIDLTKGGGGADISPLRSQGTTLISLRPDSQRYFDYHHT